MKFQMVVTEPAGKNYAHFLYDLAKLLCYTIESLGFDCSLTRNNVDPDRTNLLLCGHLLRDAQEVDKLRRSNIKYVVLQTEPLEGDLAVFGGKDLFQRVGLPLMQGAKAVWTWKETDPDEHSNVVVYERLGIKPGYYLGGYHPHMMEVMPKRNKDIDFLFFGSLSPRRREMLSQLQNRGFRLVVDFDSHALYRNDLIARSKVVVAPRFTDVKCAFSWMRICYLLNNRSLVVVENYRGQEWLEDCFPHADTEHFIDLCIATLKRPDRDEFASCCHDRFRRLPMTEQIKPLLDDLLSIAGS